MLRAASYGNVAAVRERNHSQCVFKSLRGDHVSGNNRQRAHIQFRRIQRKHDGNRIVGAGIRVDDYFFRGDRHDSSDAALRKPRSTLRSAIIAPNAIRARTMARQ